MVKSIGFIGCNSSALSHLSALMKCDAQLGEKVVGAYDPDSALAQALLHHAGSKAAPAPTLEAFFDTPRLAAVFICQPVWEACCIPQDCARRNIPFFMDTPISIGTDHLEETEKEIEKRFVMTCINNEYRYLDTVTKAVEHLMQDPPISSQMRWLLPQPTSAMTETIIHGGGLLNLWGSRLVDLSRYLFGEVSRVFALTNNTPPFANVPIDSAAQISLGFEDRNIANLTVAISSTIQEPQLEVEVVTRNARLVMSGEQLDLIIYHDGHQVRSTNATNVQMLQMQMFLNAIQRRDASGLRTSYQDSARTQTVVAGAINALRTGSVQRLRWGVLL